MSEQTPTNLSNADFTFKDKYGNTGKTKGVSNDDSTKLNNMVKLMNLMLNTPNSTDFINTLATKQYVDENQSSGLNLFDVVAKDHVLTYGEDLEGFAPLGTWVYKDAVDGSRYGYPDFVQKCLDEYAEATDDVIGVPFEQPILSANGTLGGDNFAVQASTEYSGYPAWKACNGISSNVDNGWVAQTQNNQYYIFYNPIPLKVKQLSIQNGNGSTQSILKWEILGSNDNSTWESIATDANSNTKEYAIWNINLTSNTNYYKYYKISAITDSGLATICELGIKAYEAFTVKRHSNGHVFFDVSDIEKINALYNDIKEAWLYGIDDVNERIFLPRSTRFKFGSTGEVGEYQEAGLPNITGSHVNWYMGTNSRGWVDGAIHYHPEAENIPASTNAENWYEGTVGIKFDASRSNPIYGNSNTVEYSSTKLIPYMVVGNVRVEQTSTEVIDSTTTTNDTVPLFTAHYFDYTPNNLSWLKGGSQSNSGDLYKTCYNELVNVLNGETKYGSLKVIDTSDMVEGEDYSLYWIVNQVNETFRTPTKTQQRFVVKTYQNGTDWYRIYNDGWCEQGGTYDNGSLATDWTADITMLVAFSNTNYQINCQAYRLNNVTVAINNQVFGINKTSSTFKVRAYGDGGSQYIDWIACGYIDLTNEQIDTALYFKVANAVENIQMLDVGEVTEALANKADCDLGNTSNVSQSFKNMSIDWCMPDYASAINITPIYPFTYTAPCAGVIMCNQAGTVNLTINGTVFSVGGNDSYNEGPLTVLLSKGDVIVGNADVTPVYFIPCKGAN